uniref:Uncharacterized protein n=1 Tax=Oryza barthii TaxID=65489 RepID=A0A0D3GXA1_9ORYZ
MVTGGGAPHVPEHGEPVRVGARRHRRRRDGVGAVDPRVVRRGEPPRRRAQPLHVPLRPPRHAPGGAHGAPADRLRHGDARAGEPLPRLHLRRVPGARHRHLPRQHGAQRPRPRRRRARPHMRRHRRRREAS